MRIGLVSDSLSHLPFDEFIRIAAELGVQSLEFTTGNWSTAPHLDLNKLLSSEAARKAFLKKLADYGLTLSALNASGNPLHPGAIGEAHSQCLHKTIQLANLLGVENVVTMSGLPGGSPTDDCPNWIVSSWPPETQDFLKYQWQVAGQYWERTARMAKESGCKICIELHGQQLVYNLPTFRKLRDIAGDSVGLNLDPSHLMWMGGDPLEFIRHAGPAIYHAHAKDTRIDPYNQSTTTLLDNSPMTGIHQRSWSYVTLGYGQPESWWNTFCYTLAQYTDRNITLSIEHEDMTLSCLEGVQKSVDLLKRTIIQHESDYLLQTI